MRRGSYQARFPFAARLALSVILLCTLAAPMACTRSALAQFAVTKTTLRRQPTNKNFKKQAGEQPVGQIGEFESLHHDKQKLDAELTRQLEQLAQQCQHDSLTPQAEFTKSLIPPQDTPFSLTVPILPQRQPEQDPRILPEWSTTPAGKEWLTRLDTLRKEHAKRLFELGRRAAAAAQGQLAYQCVVETVRWDPSHAAAQKLLGRQLHDGHWLSVYEIAKAKSGQVWDGRFGWVAAEDLPRLAAGQRKHQRRWITKSEDEAMHRSMTAPWDVVTEHFRVRSNQSLEGAVAMAERLERFRLAWRQLFIEFVGTERQFKGWFKGDFLGTKVERRHEVFYYKSQADYLLALSRERNDLSKTIGYYSSSNKVAHFFADEKREAHDENLLFHEAAHQLFFECRKGDTSPGGDANFWVIEGIACYLESFRDQGEYFTVGGSEMIRLQAARHRLLEDSFYIPFAELCEMGSDEFQRDERLPKIYSQSTGQTVFLIHAAEGKYRPKLLGYLSRVYAGSDHADTLFTLLERPADQLDREYRRMLEELPVPNGESP